MEDGIPICAVVGTQSAPALASDGAGGALVAWSESRDLDEDVYIQRIDLNGDTLWAAAAVDVCAAGQRQRNMQLVADGREGAIVVWEDNRGGPLTTDIYAQRIDSTGAAVWTANGIVVCSAAYDQIGPQALSDGSGGAIVAWSDARYNYFTNPPYDVFAQRVSGEGLVKWKQNGIRVCAAENAQGMPRIAGDGSGGAFVAWQDFRSGISNDIFVQRIDAAGHVVVATRLQGYGVSIVGSGIEIRWTLAEAGENTEFAILRERALSGVFDEISVPFISRADLSFTFIDKSCEPGTVYRYRVGVCGGSAQATLFETDPLQTPPMPLTLFQCNPNPFGASTSIRFYLPAQCDVAIQVYDVGGALIRRLDHRTRERGLHHIEWNANDERGARVAPGVYFYRLEAGKETLSRKMILYR